MPFARYEILLPLKYNDGTAVEPEKFEQTKNEPNPVSNAATILGFTNRSKIALLSQAVVGAELLALSPVQVAGAEGLWVYAPFPSPGSHVVAWPASPDSYSSPP